MITQLGQAELDDVVLQVGGGAMASAVNQGFRLAHRAGWVSQAMTAVTTHPGLAGRLI